MKKNFIRLNINDNYLSFGNFFRILKEESNNSASFWQADLFSIIFNTDSIADSTVNNYCTGFRAINSTYKNYINISLDNEAGILNLKLDKFANIELKTDFDVSQAMIKMQGCGAKNILLSKGSDKAVFLDNTGKFYEKEPYSGNVVNTIGCGDSMVAGFIYEYIKTNDAKKAFDFSVAVSSASAFKEGLADKNDLRKLEKYYKTNPSYELVDLLVNELADILEKSSGLQTDIYLDMDEKTYYRLYSGCSAVEVYVQNKIIHQDEESRNILWLHDGSNRRGC